MTSNSTESSPVIIPDFNIGEIVKARERLWRIDQIHKVEKEIENIKKKFIYYSVSNITGQPSSQVLIPDIEKITKSFFPKPSPDKVGFPIYQKSEYFPFPAATTPSSYNLISFFGHFNLDYLTIIRAIPTIKG